MDDDIDEPKTYEEYLESLFTTQHFKYLPNNQIRNRMVTSSDQCNYRTFLTEEEFNKKINPTEGPVGSQFYYSEKVTTKDPVILELAKREKPNQRKDIATIIFVLTRNKRGLEISGYIDYEESLRQSKNGQTDRNWLRIFDGHDKIIPKRSDLSFVNYKSGKVSYNNSENFIVVTDTDRGLHFKYIGDRILIPANPHGRESFVKYLQLYSNKLGFVIIIDHEVRRKR